MIKKLYAKVSALQIGIWVLIILIIAVLFWGFLYNGMEDRVRAALSDAVALSKETEYNEENLNKKTRLNGIVIYNIALDDGEKTAIILKGECFSAQSLSDVLKLCEENTDGRIVVDGEHWAYTLVNDDNAMYEDHLGWLFLYGYEKEYQMYRNSMIGVVVIMVLLIAAFVILSLIFNGLLLSPLEHDLASQKDMIANASHELKTPISIIETQLYIMKETPPEELPEARDRWLGEMEEQLHRMTDLVTEILELARFESNATQPEMKAFDMSNLIRRVVLGADALAFENQVEVVMDVPDRVYAYADESGIEKVVYILLENAIKYTPIQGKITVALIGNWKSIHLRVTNTGVGVSEKDKKHLFDRFYRGDKAHTSTNNFGLGLAIAKAIVQANHGTIGVNSEEGKYTEFVVNLKKSDQHRYYQQKGKKQ